MPRQARIDAPGALHHIICRGIERRKIFRDDDDRKDLVKRMGDIFQRTATGCYAWALLPNHFHLLLKTGNMPITHVMRRLLTGYAVTFNLRHRRNGRLFQNRYKSILCQQDAYLLELVRYIHLNPLRAGIVEEFKHLDRHTWAGHRTLIGKGDHPWQDTETVLRLFHGRKTIARKMYREYVVKGVPQGRRPDLIGGGLVRSAGGWAAVKHLRKLKAHLKGDERILGDSDFVEFVLARVGEQMETRYRLAGEGVGVDEVIEKAAKIFGVSADSVRTPGKQPARVRARSVAAYWAVRLLSMDGTAVGKILGLGQPAVSRAVRRGETIVREMKLSLKANVKS